MAQCVNMPVVKSNELDLIYEVLMVEIYLCIVSSDIHIYIHVHPHTHITPTVTPKKIIVEDVCINVCVREGGYLGDILILAGGREVTGLVLEIPSLLSCVLYFLTVEKENNIQRFKSGFLLD